MFDEINEQLNKIESFDYSGENGSRLRIMDLEFLRDEIYALEEKLDTWKDSLINTIEKLS